MILNLLHICLCFLAGMTWRCGGAEDNLKKGSLYEN